MQLIVNNGVTSSPSTVAVVASAGSGITIPDGLTIGQYLQVKGTVSLGTPAPAGGLDVLLKANNYNDQGLENGGPKLLLISRSPSEVGLDFITVKIPAGAMSAPFYLQAQDGVGSVTYTASAPGLASVTSTVHLAPSGLVIGGPQGFQTDLTVSQSAGGFPLTVFTAQLDPFSYNPCAAAGLGSGLLRNGWFAEQQFVSRVRANTGDNHRRLRPGDGTVFPSISREHDHYGDADAAVWESGKQYSDHGSCRSVKRKIAAPKRGSEAGP